MSKKEPSLAKKREFTYKLRRYRVETDFADYKCEANYYFLDSEKRYACFEIMFDDGTDIRVGEFLFVRAVILIDDLTWELADCFSLKSMVALFKNKTKTAP